MKAPAFQFYAADYLADENVQLMTLEEEGVYVRLLAYCWREGDIPSDLSRLSRLCKGAQESTLTEVIRCFVPSPSAPGRLIHPRLEEERRKQEDYRDQQSESGKKGAAARWRNKGNTIGDGMESPQPSDGSAMPTLSENHGDATISPMAKNGSSSSSSSSSSNNTPPLPMREEDKAVTGNPATSSDRLPEWFTTDLTAVWNELMTHLAERDALPTRMTRLTWQMEIQRNGIAKAISAIRFSISKGAKSILWDGPISRGHSAQPSQRQTERKPRPSNPNPKPSTLFPDGPPEGVTVNQW